MTTAVAVIVIMFASSNSTGWHATSSTIIRGLGQKAMSVIAIAIPIHVGITISISGTARNGIAGNDAARRIRGAQKQLDEQYDHVEEEEAGQHHLDLGAVQDVQDLGLPRIGAVDGVDVNFLLLVGGDVHEPVGKGVVGVAGGGGCGIVLVVRPFVEPFLVCTMSRYESSRYETRE